MKKQILLLASITALLLGLTSCQKVQEIQPITTPNKDVESLFKTSLTKSDIKNLSKTFGVIDYTSYEIKNITANSSVQTISFKQSDLVNTKLIVTTSTTKNITETKSCIFEITNEDNTSNNFKDLKQVKNGFLRIYFLNTGEVLEKTIKNGIESNNERTDGINISVYNNSALRYNFGSCFKNCVVSHIRSLSWVDAAACLIASEYCAAAYLLGCTGYCTLGPG